METLPASSAKACSKPLRVGDGDSAACVRPRLQGPELSQVLAMEMNSVVERLASLEARVALFDQSIETRIATYFQHREGQLAKVSQTFAEALELERESRHLDLNDLRATLRDLLRDPVRSPVACDERPPLRSISEDDNRAFHDSLGEPCPRTDGQRLLPSHNKHHGEIICASEILGSSHIPNQ
jgi:hypothetical protein